MRTVLGRFFLALVVATGTSACSSGATSGASSSSSSGGPTDGDVLPGDWERGYEAHALVPGETTPETSPPTPVTSGAKTSIALSDGTRLELPGLAVTSGEGPITTVTLARETATLDLGPLDQAATGSARVITFEPFDPTTRGIVAADVAPVLTFPAKEVGKIDHATINVARVADMMDGEKLTRTVMFLPATWDEAGNLVVRDYLFPDSVATALELADTGRTTTAAREPAPAAYVPRPRHITYVAGTFQSSANWAASPKLVRTVPQPEAAERRRPLDRVDSATRDAVEKRCFHTAIVLLHGHNEEEGLGFSGGSADAPWGVSYKRDVWTNLYEQISAQAPTECLRTYELVYPTYRPIFTPQSGRERLDEAFSRLLAAELKPQLDAKVPIEVVLVAHSMGGLVARAGVQLFPRELQGSLKEVVTWGTPHTGSPLVTLRYAFAAVPGYEARKGLVSVGLDNVDHTLYALRRAVENLQVDSPGTRDLRWANSATTTPRELALDQIFELSPDQVPRDQHFDLVNGPLLYNENLTRLNGEDIYRTDPRYVATFGVTTKRAKLSWRFGKWFKPTIDTGGDIAIGATAISWLVRDPTATYVGQPLAGSDGAAPVTSLAGAGVVALASVGYAGDVDHEEYFGAPTAPGSFTKKELALDHAANTLRAHRFGACPPLSANLTDNLWTEPSRWELSGSFSWPNVTAPRTLLNVGAGVRLALVPGGPGLAVNDVAFSEANPSWLSGWVAPKDVPTNVYEYQLRTTVTLVDGTFASYTGSPHTGCVTPETEVTMSDGSRRRIDAIERGDFVAAYEPGDPGRRVEARVERVLVHHGAYTMRRLVTGGGVELEVTGNHPVLTYEGGYQPVSAVAPGDRVFVLDPATGRFEPRPVVAVVEDVSRRGVVYNLKTSHGQYVAADIVVHNKCLARGASVDTPSGPRAVESLRPGDLVLTRVDGEVVPTTVTHAYVKRTVLPSLPGRLLTPRLRVTDNHVLVGEAGERRRAGDAQLPARAIEGAVFDLATAAGTYLADGVLLQGTGE